MKRSVIPGLLVGLALLSACIPPTASPSSGSGGPARATTAPSTAAPAETMASPLPTATAQPATLTPATTAPTMATALPAPLTPPGFTTYRDAYAGFALDYPSDWSLLVPRDEVKRESQAYTASFRSAVSAARPGGEGLAPGATAIDVTVYKTQAAGFEELIDERRAQIAQSETPAQIVSEEVWSMAGGVTAMRWEIDTQRIGRVSELVTLLNGNGLIIWGNGELAQFDAIAHSLRRERGPAATAPAGVTAVAQGNWQTYAEPSLGFSLSFPPEWELCQDSGVSRVFCRKQAEPSGPAFPAFWVTVTPQGFTNSDFSAYNFMSAEDVEALAALPVGQSRETKGTPGYSTYTRLSDMMVGVFPGVVIENTHVWEGGATTRDRRVLVTVGSSSYTLGAYYETAAQLAEFEQVLARVQIYNG